MAIVQVILATIFRSAGRLLNTAFGWATITLFGRVPDRRQGLLSVIALGSVVWLIALVGLAVPRFAAFLLTFVALPSWVDRAWIRIAMAIVAVAVPPLVGWLAARATNQPTTIATLLRGYSYTVGLALALVMMTVFAPIMRLRDLIRRWTTAHVPVIVKPEDYADVLDDVQRILGMGAIDTERRPASWMVRVPARVLTMLAREAVADVAAQNLTRLVGRNAEVLLHPSDLVISGREAEAMRARALLAEHLTYTRAYLTWAAEAHEIEDAIRAVWEQLDQAPARELMERLEAISARLDRTTIPYEQWEVLFRQRLLAELAVVKRHAEASTRRRERMLRALAEALPAAAQAVVASAAVMREAREGQQARSRPFPPTPAGLVQRLRRLWRRAA